MSEYEVELYKIIGEMLRNIRIERGITLEQVAERLKLTAKTVQRYETGERKIKINTVMELAEYFCFDYSNFMSEAKSRLSYDHESPYVMTVRETPSYYLNNETAKIAQEIYENEDMRSLFDVARDIKPDRLKAYIEFMRALKDKEDNK